MNNDFERPDVLALVPEAARRILDVGCGTGRLAAALKAQCPERNVVGVDTDRNALREAMAEGRVDAAVCRDAARLRPEDVGSEPFDCIVCADVLEHLVDPWAAVKRLRSFLAPEGVLVTSVPNARNWQVLGQLIEGCWQYEPAGLLDRTHLRMFTRRSMEQMLDAAGYVPNAIRGVAGPGYDEWEQTGKPTRVEIGRTEIHDLSESDACDLYIYQWLTQCRANPAAGREGKTSIIIPVLNSLDLTQACIESIRRHTPERHEIIVVDNGSTDGTADWCAAQADVRLIRNEENRGFPAACNQGIAASCGQQVLLLNNDTLATPGWLRRMIWAMQSAPKVGLVGPRSNNVSGAQCIANVGYRTPLEMDAWAWQWTKRRSGEYIPTGRLVGFCLLIARDLLNEVGGLDENFGIGNFEDDDLGRRAEAAGFRLLIANDSFVHHIGSATFKREGIDYQTLMAENAARIAEKYRA